MGRCTQFIFNGVAGTRDSMPTQKGFTIKQ
jgi:hypothetical protein